MYDADMTTIGAERLKREDQLAQQFYLVSFQWGGSIQPVIESLSFSWVSLSVPDGRWRSPVNKREKKKTKKRK